MMKTPKEQTREAAYKECAEYLLKLHLTQHPNTGAIDALKTAYDYFIDKAALAAGGNHLDQPTQPE